MTEAFQIARHYSSAIHNGRTMLDALRSLEGEVAEIRVEVETGNTGPDGIKGESMDVLNSVLDILFMAHPGITSAEIDEIMERKCRKWMVKYSQDFPVEIEHMLTAGHILKEMADGGLPLEISAAIAGVEVNSVLRILGGSLPARRTEERLNRSYPLLSKVFEDGYRVMMRMWVRRFDDRPSLSELFASETVDLDAVADVLEAAGRIVVDYQALDMMLYESMNLKQKVAMVAVSGALAEEQRYLGPEGEERRPYWELDRTISSHPDGAD